MEGERIDPGIDQGSDDADDDEPARLSENTTAAGLRRHCAPSSRLTATVSATPPRPPQVPGEAETVERVEAAVGRFDSYLVWIRDFPRPSQASVIAGRHSQAGV
ncbi:hypothetical protein PSA01_19730 [Pseudonocardia saturnea]|uniref:Uncharacterized protein n=1 Tax=Pseudonocardia saturnea TaxID=33909 RepID=A0ABQ0RW94_9PSEU|nr:hypothetical protein Pdca_47330 [Pseudonocardia autotrophica]GEC24944.1 hypothetical protein PSA01_19730 [Pseudonocardia saturnea]